MEEGGHGGHGGGAEEELALDDQEAGAGGEVKVFATPEELLDMAESKRDRLFKRSLDFVRDTGHQHPSDLQLLILPSFPTAKTVIPGYGEFDPLQLGIACIVLPPPEGGAPRTEGSKWGLNPDGISQKKKTSEAGLIVLRMSLRPHAGLDLPQLPGKFLKFLLEEPPISFLVLDPAQAATRNRRDPYVVMYTRKPLGQTRVAVPEPATAVDEARTPADAPPPGTLAAGSEIHPERPESPDFQKVTGLVERLSLAGASDGGEGGGAAASAEPMLERGAVCEIAGLVAAAQHNGKRCTLTEFLEASGRWKVKLECGAVLGVRPANLELKLGTECQRLQSFALAYSQRGKFDQAGLLGVRCAEACGAVKSFSEQAKALKSAGECFLAAGDYKNSALWLESARDLSAEQGIVSMECDMCTKLGHAFFQAGRFIEGVEQHRRACRVAQSVGEKRAPFRFLVNALCSTGENLEEAETLFLRLREGRGNTADCQLWDHYLRGSLHMRSDKYDDASLSFRAAVDVAAKHPEVLQDPNAEYALQHSKGYLKQCVGAGDAPPLVTVVAMINQAGAARDWPGVLRWESRLEELLTLAEASHPQLISAFAWANFDQGHYEKASRLFQKRVQLLGKMERYSEQGKDMCKVGDCFVRLNDAKGADTWYQHARKLGDQHGLYSAECAACLGLGRVAMYMHKEFEDAEELLQHALTVLEFVEGDGGGLEGEVKMELSKALMGMGYCEEAGPLIQRVRDLAERAGADNIERVFALSLAVRFQTTRGDVATAGKEMTALEEAFKRVPDGVQKASYEPMLESARKSILEVMGTDGAPSLATIMNMVASADDRGDSGGVLRWESRLDDMLGNLEEVEHQLEILRVFALTNFNAGHFDKAASSFQRCVLRLGQLERFRDQATTLSEVGMCFILLNDTQPGAFEGAAICYEKARKLGEQHGFYSAECGACVGLGHVEYMRGRKKEAEELIRHALTVVEFVEDQRERETLELEATNDLARLLLETGRYEEAGPLLQRWRELATDRDNMIRALASTVHFQVMRGDVEQAMKEMEALEDVFRGAPDGSPHTSFGHEFSQSLVNKARERLQQLRGGAGVTRS